MSINQIQFNELIRAILDRANLENRTEAIVSGRFGLNSPKSVTLQSLGTHFGITRERVRQIESQALTEIGVGVSSLKELEIIKNFVANYMQSSGGIKLDSHLVTDIYNYAKSNDNLPIFGNQLRFLLQLINYPNFSSSNDTYHDFWYEHKDHLNILNAIHDEVVSQITKVEDFHDVLRSVINPKGVNETTAISYLSVSKKIGVGPYGDIGLYSWPEIAPKTVRAKAYLLLKKQKTPMHFTEIAKSIGSHAPTVHNELIKDPQFKLVGRGVYSLEINN